MTFKKGLGFRIKKSNSIFLFLERLRNIAHHRVYILVIILLIINAALLILVLNRPTVSGYQKPIIYNPKQLENTKDAEIFDLPCPDLQIVDRLGKKSSLSYYIGNVLIIRFTRFHPQDIPYLVFLDQLGKKYYNMGLRLFIINYLGMNPPASMSFSSPIIDDDGYISSAFQASLNDTIIIGRDFRIKLKSNNLETRTIHDQAARYLGPSRPVQISNFELSSTLDRVSYRDAASTDIKKIGEFVDEKIAIISLFISACLNCPENQRIKMLKEIAAQRADKRIMLLFGLGNSLDLINSFADRNDLYKYFIVGIIERTPDLVEEDYYNILRLDLNPRILVFSKGRLLIAETEDNREKIAAIVEDVYKK